jgi:hypothetical protein
MRVRLKFQDTYDDAVYEVEPSSTVLEFKQRMSAVFGVPPDLFWLSNHDKILDNDETFEQAGIKEGEELDVNGVIGRVLDVHRPEAVYHPAGGDDTLRHVGAALRSDLAKLQRLAL